MQSGAQGPALRFLQCHEWRSTRMPAITFHISSCYRLDIEDHHRGSKEWNSVDHLVTAEGLRLRADDDLALLSHNHEQMQSKTTGLAAASKRRGLKINRGKSKVMRINTIKENLPTVEGERLEEVGSFTYLGSVMDKRGTDVDVAARIGTSRVTFNMLKTTPKEEEEGTPQKQLATGHWCGTEADRIQLERR